MNETGSAEAPAIVKPTTVSIEAPVFRLHLEQEPSTLLPPLQKTSAASYLTGNLYRNLLKFDDEKGLQPDLATCTQKTPLRIECQLKKDLKWSDGTALTAQDFLKTYLFILDPQNKISKANLLFDLKNAKDIYAGEDKKLGVTAPSNSLLKFELARPQPEFIYQLASLILSPGKDGAFSGPYQLAQWKKGEKIRIEKNPFYQGGVKDRPPVEFVFIEEDSVALQLYEKNELHLLRRLPTLYVPRYRERKDFHWIPVARFDYIGFGPALQENLPLRKALSLSLRYSELQQIFSSVGTPGCAGLPDTWFEAGVPCLQFDLAAAQKAWAQVAPADQKKNYPLLFSAQGGEDPRRGAEWMQAQWQKLGVQISPTARENKTYLSEMKSSPPALFRKGLAVDRPRCLAALQTFRTKEPENYIHLQSPEYDKILDQLILSPQEKDQKRLCTQGVRYLIDHFLLIPLGRFDFAMLVKSEFHGWRFNEMNQLDLAELHVAK